MEARREGNDPQNPQTKTEMTRILYSVKILFKIESEIKIITDKNKEFISSKPILLKMLKIIPSLNLRSEGKDEDYQKGLILHHTLIV